MVRFDRYKKTQTYYEDGEVVRIVQKNYDGNDVFKDMEIRNGEEWNGYVNGCDRRYKFLSYSPEEFHEQKYTVKDGNYVAGNFTGTVEVEHGRKK